jgi:hypothetical protein
MKNGFKVRATLDWLQEGFKVRPLTATQSGHNRPIEMFAANMHPQNHPSRSASLRAIKNPPNRSGGFGHSLRSISTIRPHEGSRVNFPDFRNLTARHMRRFALSRRRLPRGPSTPMNCSTSLPHSRLLWGMGKELIDCGCFLSK